MTNGSNLFDGMNFQNRPCKRSRRLWLGLVAANKNRNAEKGNRRVAESNPRKAENVPRDFFFATTRLSRLCVKISLSGEGQLFFTVTEVARLWPGWSKVSQLRLLELVRHYIQWRQHWDFALDRNRLVKRCRGGVALGAIGPPGVSRFHASPTVGATVAGVAVLSHPL